uniref:CCHC-type domain-containing protein n=1 Tax=Triticum urartu TaxID=4572 RepID=A0A8R7Q7U8_TRIUA
VTCFRCKQTGHYANKCHDAKTNNGNGSGNSNGNSGVKKPNPFPQAQVNHIDVEEVYDQPDTVIYKFLWNSHMVLALFDFGETHSFIPRVVVEKCGLPTRTLRSPLQVSSLGG